MTTIFYMALFLIDDSSVCDDYLYHVVVWCGALCDCGDRDCGGCVLVVVVVAFVVVMDMCGCIQATDGLTN